MIQYTRKISIKTHPTAITYYLFAAPAIVAIILLAGTYLFNLDTVISAANNVIPPLEILRETATTIALILPGLAIVSCFYGLLTFRPTSVVATVTVFYLVLTSIIGTVDFYYAVLVVGSCFTTLIGFNFSRAYKIQGHRRVISESQGPRKYQLVTLGFDILLPIGIVLCTIVLIVFMISVIKAQVNILPSPLGTLGTLYLESHLYLMLTTLTVAGAMVWILRQFFEPVLLRVTLTRQDAHQYALWELQSDMRRDYWHSVWRPRSGMRSLRLRMVILGSLIIIVILLIGPAGPSELLKIFGMASPGRDSFGYTINYNTKLVVRTFDHAVFWFEGILKILFKILWG